MCIEEETKSHGLAYDSQHEQPYDRALCRAQNIREGLGGSGSLAEPFPMKPKGMHWQTYSRLYLKAEAASRCSWPNWVYRLVASNRLIAAQACPRISSFNISSDCN